MRPSQSSAAFLAGVGVALAAIAAALCAALWRVEAQGTTAAKTIAVLFALYMLPLLVLLHEFGHLLVARAVGWRVPILVLGGFSLRFRNLRFSAGAPPFGTNVSGAVVAVPPENGSTRWRWIAVHAGGPLANILIALLAFVAAKGAPPTAHEMMLGLGWVSLIKGLYNLVPAGGSDGAHILFDLRASGFARRGRIMRLQAQRIDGIRPRDWDVELVRAVQADAVWTRDPEGPLAVYEWHLDRGEIDAARATLRRAAAHSRGSAAVTVEEVFLAATLDGASARQRLTQAGSWHIRQSPPYWRAETATALVEADEAAAREALRKWRIVLKDWPYATEDEWDWLRKFEDRAARLAREAA
jgi:Zn-dependent protease